MKKLIFVACLLAAVPAHAQGERMSGSGAAIATERSDTTAQPNAGPATPGERRICRNVETASGSRMAYRRMCMTAQQWRNFNRGS